MEKTEGKYTVADVIQITADMLSRVRLPVHETEAIGIIMSAIKNLDECVLAMKRDAKTGEKEKVTDDV